MKCPRSIETETGYQTEVLKLVAVYDQQQPPFIHRYRLIFKCEITGGSAAHSNQVKAFFKENDLPTVANAGLTSLQISRLFEHHRNPSLRTDFD